MKQGGDEWFAARLGRLTASRMADVIATTKTGYSASRAGYAVELAGSSPRTRGTDFI